MSTADMSQLLVSFCSDCGLRAAHGSTDLQSEVTGNRLSAGIQLLAAGRQLVGSSKQLVSGRSRRFDNVLSACDRSQTILDVVLRAPRGPDIQEN
eukprot:221033-Chlamydomonas_euryale.AAC.1